MVEIQIISQISQWNQSLENFGYLDVFSSFEWGEYKKSQGWNIERMLFLKKSQLIGACQFIYKTKFKILFGWNSGGILFFDPKDLLEISKAIQKHYCGFFFLHRFNFYQKLEANTNFFLSQAFSSPHSKINSPFSIVFDFSQPHKLSSNHRYYLKQSQKNNLQISFQINSQQSLQDFWITYNQMSIDKKLKAIQLSQKQISTLSQAFGEKMIVCNVYNDSQQPLCSCIILTCNNRAFYYLASSSEEGRKTFASYFMVDKLLQYLKEKEFKSLNFGGITPYDQNAFGVNRFKMGFGGEIVEYLGERDLYNSSLLNKLLNYFILRKCK